MGKGKLSPKELNEFYKLLDEVVIESKKERSTYLKPDETPERFLLNLLKNRIKNTAFNFFINKIQYVKFAKKEAKIKEEKSAESISIEETSTFQEWYDYAERMTRVFILGDATRRRDRRKEVMPYYDKFESSEEKLLTLNFLQGKGCRDKHLGQVKRKNLAKIKRPERIKKQERLSREFNWNDPWAGLENIKGDGFLIRDSTAINVALENALSQGIGYDPDYKPPELKGLIDLKKLADAALSNWEA